MLLTLKPPCLLRQSTGEDSEESEDSEEEDYEVERIVGKRKRSSRVEYRVRWYGQVSHSLAGGLDSALL